MATSDAAWWLARLTPTATGSGRAAYYKCEVDDLSALFAEDRREMVKALRMARADLMAWASHDAMDDRDAVQARYANTPAIRAIDAALAKEGVGAKHRRERPFCIVPEDAIANHDLLEGEDENYGDAAEQADGVRPNDYEPAERRTP